MTSLEARQAAEELPASSRRSEEEESSLWNLNFQSSSVSTALHRTPLPPQVIHKKMTSPQNTANLGYYANGVDSTFANRQISGPQLQIMFKTDFTHLILLRVTRLIS